MSIKRHDEAPPMVMTNGARERRGASYFEFCVDLAMCCFNLPDMFWAAS